MAQKQSKKNAFVSRDEGALLRKQARGGNLPGTKEEPKPAEAVTPVTTAKTTAELYVQQAKNIVIGTEDDYANATNILLSVKNAAELAELEKNKVLVPAEQVVKAEKARWKPIEMLFKEINDLIRPKMKKYLDDKEEAARQALATLNKQIASGQIKKETTIARKEDEIYANVPAKTVYTGSGSSSARKVAKLKITNESLIPDEYWVIDEVKLRKDVVTAGKKVPGAEVVYENSIAII